MNRTAATEDERRLIERFRNGSSDAMPADVRKRLRTALKACLDR